MSKFSYSSVHRSSQALKREPDLKSVLNAIGAGQGQGVDGQAIKDARLKRQSGEVDDSPQAAPVTNFEPPKQAEPQLRVAPGTAQDSEQDVFGSEDWLASTIESAKQIQQLASRLAARQLELETRQEELEQAESSWSDDRDRDQQEFEKRWSQLQQQTSQVRIQQRHVMQLQSDLVKHQQAIRASIESLIGAEVVDSRTTRELKQLQHELGPRFDYIMRRWEHLYQLLENQRVQIVAASGADDRVSWNR